MAQDKTYMNNTNLLIPDCYRMEWTVRARTIFRIFSPVGDDLSKPRAYLLAEADAGGKVEAMRLAYHGRDPVTAVFEAKDLFPYPELEPYSFVLQAKPETITPPDNAVATAWEDCLSLAAGLHLTVYKAGQEDKEGFIKVLKHLQEKDYTLGGVVRWSLQAVGPRTVQLALQGLPASIGRIKAKSRFQMDNFPAITLATFPVEMEFSSGHYIIGPRAVICAPNPAAVEGALQQDPTPALPGNGWQKLRGNLLPVPAYPGYWLN
jgi:hypothetical protein